MSAIFLVVVGLGAMALGYIFYSRFIAQKIYQLDDSRPTPAHEFEDGVDFVPTNKYVLWATTLPLSLAQHPLWVQPLPLFGGGCRHFYGWFWGRSFSRVFTILGPFGPVYATRLNLSAH